MGALLIVTSCLTITPCNQHIYGCGTCSHETKLGQDYYKCTTCMPGLYLYTNTTTLGTLSGSTTGCVQECQSIAHYLVNDPIQRQCGGCGEGCKKCHPIHGCLTCQGEDLKQRVKVQIQIQVGKIQNTKFSFCKSCSDETIRYGSTFPCAECELQGDSPVCTKTTPEYSNLTQRNKYLQVPDQAYPNCAVITQQPKPTCVHCKSPYLIQNGECTVKCDANCGQCKDGCPGQAQGPCPTCVKCEVGYFLLQNQCKICGSGDQQIDGSRCETCGPNGICTSCRPPYQAEDLSDGVTVKCDRLKLKQCASNCDQCYGKTANQCLRCISGYYLTTSGCQQQKSEPHTLDLIVNNDPTSPTSQNGSLTHPYTDLMSAIQDGLSSTQAFTQPIIKIWLTNQEHYILPQVSNLNSINTTTIQYYISSKASLIIQPIPCDITISKTPISQTSLQCSKGGIVTIINKAGGYFNLNIQGGLSLRNVHIDSIDSLLPSNDACVHEKERCCRYDEVSKSLVSAKPGSQCSLSTDVRYQCTIPGGISMFNLHSNSQLELMNVIIDNTFHELRSIVQLPSKEAATLTFTNLTIIRTSQCINMVNNKPILFPQSNEVEGVSKLNQFGRILQLRSIRLRVREIEQMQSTSSGQVGEIIFRGMRVEGVGWGQGLIGGVAGFGAQENEVVIGLEGFKGRIMLSGLHIQGNMLNNTNCELYDKLLPQSINTLFQPISQFSRPIILISNSKHELEILHSKFTHIHGYNSGLIKLSSPQAPTIIHNNTFTHNSGLTNSALIMLTQTSLCGSITISQNTYTHTLHCKSNITPTIVQLTCTNPSIPQAQNPNQVAQSTSGVDFKQAQTRVESNTYQQNHYGFSGMVQVGEYPDIVLRNEQASDNVANVFSEAAIKLGVKTQMESWGGIYDASVRFYVLSGLVYVQVKNVSFIKEVLLSPRIARQAMLINVETHADCKDIVLEQIEFRDIIGADVTLLRQYTSLSIEDLPANNYILIDGKTKIYRGITGPLIHYTLSQQSTLVALNKITLNNIKIQQNPNQHPTDLIYTFNQNKIPTSLTLTHFTISNLHTYNTAHRLFYIKQTLTSTYTLTNINITHYGTSISSPAPYSPITIKVYHIITPSQKLNITNLWCKHLFVKDGGCIDIHPSDVGQDVNEYPITIKGGVMQYVHSKYGTFYIRSGYSNVSLTMSDMVFRDNRATYSKGSGGIKINNVQQASSTFSFINCSFYNLSISPSSSAVYGYAIELYSMSLSNKMTFKDIFIDCLQPMMSKQEYQDQMGRYDSEKGTYYRALIMIKLQAITMTNITAQNCHKLLYGLLYIRKSTTLQDIKLSNMSGYYTAGINQNTGSTTIKVFNLVTKGLMSNQAAAYRLRTGKVRISDSVIQDSYSLQYGCVYSSGYDNFNLNKVKFINNYGEQTSVVKFQFFNDNETSFNDVEFTNNTALLGGIVDLTFAKLNLYRCNFTNNYVNGGYPGLFMIQSEVYMVNTNFKSDGRTQNALTGYINTLLNSRLVMRGVKFIGGYFNQAGGINIEGKSYLDIQDSEFIGLRVKNQGAGIELSHITRAILKNIRFINCTSDIPILGGSVLHAHAEGIHEYTNLTFSNHGQVSAQNTIFLLRTTIIALHITINNTYHSSMVPNKELQISCGLHLLDMVKINMSNLHITGCEGTKVAGGMAISYSSYVLSPDLVHEIRDTMIQENSALENAGGILIQFVKQLRFYNVSVVGNRVVKGTGGGVQYVTQDVSDVIDVRFDESSVVQGNHANGIGGGIQWNWHSLNQLPGRIANNTASEYGQDFASYSSKLKVIQNYTSNSSRYLTFAGPLYTNIRSGAQLPTIWAALLDLKDQIVTTDSINGGILAVDSNVDKFPPIIKGNTRISANKGMYEFKDITIIGQPGKLINITIRTKGVNSQFPDNLKYSSQSSNFFNTSIIFRNCSRGEQYMPTGECRQCDKDIYYSLKLHDAPSECKKCVGEKMICRGGAKVGPKQGYWRENKYSEVFYKCLHEEACLGMIAPKLNELGECQQGYAGRLCNKCTDGFSLQDNYKCLKCSTLYLQILQLTFTVVVVAILLVIFIKVTIDSATKPKKLSSIFIKILMNHIQLITLTYTFEFNWPLNVQSFYNTQKPVANFASQIISVDCLLQNMPSLFGISVYTTTLIQFGLLPVFLVIAACIFWKVRSLRCIGGNPGKFWEKVSPTVIILMFLIHPTLVQVMFDNTNCMQIEGSKYLIKSIDVECYKGKHLLQIFIISIPSLVIYGLGIPTLASLILFKHRSNLKDVDVRYKYGFLFNGYKRQRYYWESVIMYRKIIIILISVQVKQYGIIIQALLVALILITFLIINIQLQPFYISKLNQMETLSLTTCLITIYCGFFYLSHHPHIYQSDNEELQVADNGVRLNHASHLVIFLTIIITNISFLLLWGMRFMIEIWKTLQSTFPKMVNLLARYQQKKQAMTLQQSQIKDESQMYRGELEYIIGKIYTAFDNHDLVLDEDYIEKIAIHLDVDNIKSAIRYKDPFMRSKVDVTYDGSKRTMSSYPDQHLLDVQSFVKGDVDEEMGAGKQVNKGAKRQSVLPMIDMEELFKQDKAQKTEYQDQIYFDPQPRDLQRVKATKPMAVEQKKVVAQDHDDHQFLKQRRPTMRASIKAKNHRMSVLNDSILQSNIERLNTQLNKQKQPIKKITHIRDEHFSKKQKTYIMDINLDIEENKSKSTTSDPSVSQDQEDMSDPNLTRTMSYGTAYGVQDDIELEHININQTTHDVSHPDESIGVDTSQRDHTESDMVSVNQNVLGQQRVNIEVDQESSSNCVSMADEQNLITTSRAGSQQDEEVPIVRDLVPSPDMEVKQQNLVAGTSHRVNDKLDKVYSYQDSPIQVNSLEQTFNQIQFKKVKRKHRKKLKKRRKLGKRSVISESCALSDTEVLEMQEKFNLMKQELHHSIILTKTNKHRFNETQ